MAMSVRAPHERWATLATPTVEWSGVRDLLYAHRARLALGLLLMVVNRIAGLAVPLASKYLFDDVIGRGNWERLSWLAMATGAATLVDVATAFANSRVLGVAAHRAIATTRQRLARHVLRLPTAFFDSTKTGVLVSRIMMDADGIRNIIGNGAVQLVGSFLTATMALAILLWVNPSLTIVTIGILLALGGGLAAALTRLRPQFREGSRILADVTGRLAETLNGVRTVKVYTAERREDLVFTRGTHRLLRNVARTMSAASALSVVSGLAVGTTSILVMVLGGNAVKAQTMSVGDLVMYVSLIALLTTPVAQLASIGTQVTEAFAGLDRIREMVSTAREDQHEEGRAEVPVGIGDVAFDNVMFEYVPGVPVLRRVSFVAGRGTTTALVGASGSGKSTLISLLLAFNRPTSGRVLVDGLDLNDMKLREYRRHLGVVLQDNFLFDGTIAENIAFGRPDATREEIVTVGRIAHCHGFVARLPDGYDTVVGERGVQLSGGQRQRVAIARALLADPSILVLDEATSSLDSESEGLIRDGLRSLRQGRTTFVIAHRLSTIRDADQILVLDEGDIVERGTHEQLMALNGRYRDLHDRQYAANTELASHAPSRRSAPAAQVS